MCDPIPGMSKEGRYKDLLKRVSETLHQVTKDTDGIWTYLWAHDMEYSGAQYGEILKEIDKELGLEYPDEE